MRSRAKTIQRLNERCRSAKRYERKVRAPDYVDLFLAVAERERKWLRSVMRLLP